MVEIPDFVRIVKLPAVPRSIGLAYDWLATERQDARIADIIKYLEFILHRSFFASQCARPIDRPAKRPQLNKVSGPSAAERQPQTAQLKFQPFLGLSFVPDLR